MTEREFHGSVTPEGQVKFDDPLGWKVNLSSARGKRVVCTIALEQPRRSVGANKRYWSILVPLAGHFLSRGRDVPLSKGQVHYVLASAFAGTVETKLGVPVPVQTRVFTKEQFHTYCTKIESWLGENGYPIPEPGEIVEAML